MTLARIALAVFVLALAACGGAPAQPEEEVTATWTSGDDAELESPPEE